MQCFPKCSTAMQYYDQNNNLLVSIHVIVVSLQDEYREKHPYGVNPVLLNDVVFSLHAVLLCSITILQTLIYDVSISHRYIYHRYKTSYTAPCNGVVTHGVQFGGLHVFADHTCKNKRKTNAFTIFMCRTAFNAYLSSRSRRQYMHVTHTLAEPQLF